MQHKMKMAVLAATLVMGGCAQSLDEVKVNAGSSEGLAKTLEHVKEEFGEEAARSIVEDMGFIVGNYFSDPALDQAYGKNDTQVVLEKIDSLRNEALADIDGMTVKELRQVAKPLEHAYLLERKEKALPRLEAFEAEKARVLEVRALRDDLKVNHPVIERNEDEFGYLEPSLALELVNSSDLTIRAMDLDVYSWSTMDEDINGSSKVTLSFAEDPVEPGDKQTAAQPLSPLSELSSAIAQGAGQGVRIKILVVYSEEKGRTEMSATWTDEMEANLAQLREYAAYGEE